MSLWFSSILSLKSWTRCRSPSGFSEILVNLLLFLLPWYTCLGLISGAPGDTNHCSLCRRDAGHHQKCRLVITQSVLCEGESTEGGQLGLELVEVCILAPLFTRLTALGPLSHFSKPHIVHLYMEENSTLWSRG